MRAISLHVDEAKYREIKAIALQSGRPVAELIRQAMAEYVDSHRGRPSLHDIEPLPGGRTVQPWTRSEVFDEMVGASPASDSETDEGWR